MSTNRIKIEEATAEQLRDFASIALGLEVEGHERTKMMISRIQEAGYLGEDFPDFTTPKPNHAPDQSSKFQNENIRTNEQGNVERRILIPEVDRPGGSDSVVVGVNGVIRLYPRGVPYWVEESFLEVLRNAVEFVYPEFKGERADNGIDLGGLRKPKQVLSYPYQTV